MAASYAVHMLRYAATAPWIAATPGACEAVGEGADNVSEGDGLGCAPPDLQAVTVQPATTTTMANETIRTRRTCTSPNSAAPIPVLPERDRLPPPAFVTRSLHV